MSQAKEYFLNDYENEAQRPVLCGSYSETIPAVNFEEVGKKFQGHEEIFHLNDSYLSIIH